MWILKNDFQKCVLIYYKYFNLKEENNIKDYIDLQKKIIKQLNKMSDTELKNLQIQLTIETSKQGVNWSNYIALRLAEIAIGVSVIIGMIQYYPNLIKHGEIYLIILLGFASLYLYTFSYKYEKNEDRKIFLKFVLKCLNEILEKKEM